MIGGLRGRNIKVRMRLVWRSIRSGFNNAWRIVRGRYVYELRDDGRTVLTTWPSGDMSLRETHRI